MQEKKSFTLISEDSAKRLTALGITEPSAVQERVIPIILTGKNTVFQSETGTGKTFAYLLPLIKRLESQNSIDGLLKSVRIIVSSPTIELASQIKTACNSVTNFKCVLLVGGAPLKRQIEALKEKPQIVIGTPARITELIRLKKLKTADLIACVYDEADRLLKKEMKADSAALKAECPKETQFIACSATINKTVTSFFDGAETQILPAEDILTKHITHQALYAESRDKIETLRKFLNAAQPQKAIIFTSRADQVENIASKLKYKHIDCAALYAKADKKERKAAMDSFRRGKTRFLVTSDLAARGLDIPGITDVIQMDFTEDADFFVHRAGRTGRAGKSGTNTVIGDEYEMRAFAALEKKLGITVYPKELRGGKVISPTL